MSSEANKKIVRRFCEEVINEGRVELLPELVAEAYAEVMDGRRHELGLEGAKAHALGIRESYPDLHLTVDRQIADGERVVSCVTTSGTHLSEWIGIAPTGKRVTLSGPSG